jgi:hypothetical protein
LEETLVQRIIDTLLWHDARGVSAGFLSKKEGTKKTKKRSWHFSSLDDCGLPREQGCFLAG